MKTIISRKTKNKSTWKFPTGYGYSMLLFAVLLALMIFSCNKNELIERNTGNENTMGFHKSGLQIDLTGVDILNGILVFEDSAKYFSIIDQLDESCDDYWDYIIEAMLSEYGEQTEEEFNAMLEQLQIHEDQPLLDFEEFFVDFFSLRKHLEVLELEWLEDPTAPDPDDHDIIDESERATYNSLGEVIIGTNIIKVFTDPCGTTIIIKDLDFELLETIRGLDVRDLDTALYKNIQFVHECGTDNPEVGCENARNRVKVKNVYPIENAEARSGDWIKYKFKYVGTPKRAQWIGVVKNYHNKGKRRRTCDVLMCGKNYNNYNGDCELNIESQNGAKEKRKRSYRRILPGSEDPLCESSDCIMLIKSGESTATFGSGNFQTTVALEW